MAEHAASRRRRDTDGSRSPSRSPPHTRRPRSSRHDRSRSPEAKSHHRTRRRSASRSPSRRHHRSRRDQSASPRPGSHRHHHRRRSARSRSRSRSRSHSPRRRNPSTSPPPVESRSRAPLPSQEQSFRQDASGTDAIVSTEPPAPKEAPNFKPTGLLAAETNKVSLGGNVSIVLKYHEPPEARKPPSSQPWMLYVFKGAAKDPLDTIPLHARSCWLLGREAAVADIPVEHPSCSKQHAVFQFRYVTKKDQWGEKKGGVRLYVLDLESANGTSLNGEKIDAARYVECRSGDVVKFGDSTRDYVLLLPPKE